MKIIDNIKNKVNEFLNPQKKQTQKENYTEHDYVSYYTRDLLDSVYNGDKYAGSFGSTKLYKTVDYYTLRARSVQLFTENVYARGIVRRFLTNIIYKGINLEANPLSQFIGMTDEEAIVWSENTELLWDMWSKDSYICDYNKLRNLGQLEIEIKQTALISGDCLVILRINPKTKLPCIEIIDGSHIQTPVGYEPRKGNKIKYGVEIDGLKRHVAYHVYVEKKDGAGYEYKRIPCYGEKSGRKIAWLVYGSDKLLDEIRGTPILANMLVMLRDLDRYRDASARAAVVNSLYPFLIRKTEKSVGQMPFGAVKRQDDVTVSDSSGITTQTLNFGIDNPGTIHQLPYGLEVEPLNYQKSDVNLGKFEEIILNVFSWSLEMPPEIVRLLFQSNFSASRQANNEVQLLIDKQSWLMGCDFLQSLYEEWIISNVISGKIKAEGLLDAWLNEDWEIYGAWLNAEWTGLNRPSVDELKDVQAEEFKLKTLTTTYDAACKKLSKLKFRTILKKRQIEQKMIEESGLSSSVDENNNGEPAGNTVNDQDLNNDDLDNNDTIQDLINRINKLEAK